MLQTQQTDQRSSTVLAKFRQYLDDRIPLNNDARDLSLLTCMRKSFASKQRPFKVVKMAIEIDAIQSDEAILAKDVVLMSVIPNSIAKLDADMPGGSVRVLREIAVVCYTVQLLLEWKDQGEEQGDSQKSNEGTSATQQPPQMDRKARVTCVNRILRDICMAVYKPLKAGGYHQKPAVAIDAAVPRNAIDLPVIAAFLMHALCKTVHPYVSSNYELLSALWKGIAGMLTPYAPPMPMETSKESVMVLLSHCHARFKSCLHLLDMAKKNGHNDSTVLLASPETIRTSIFLLQRLADIVPYHMKVLYANESMDDETVAGIWRVLVRMRGLVGSVQLDVTTEALLSASPAKSKHRQQSQPQSQASKRSTIETGFHKITTKAQEAIARVVTSCNMIATSNSNKNKDDNHDNDNDNSPRNQRPSTMTTVIDQLLELPLPDQRSFFASTVPSFGYLLTLQQILDNLPSRTRSDIDVGLRVARSVVFVAAPGCFEYLIKREAHHRQHLGEIRGIVSRIVSKTAFFLSRSAALSAPRTRKTTLMVVRWLSEQQCNHPLVRELVLESARYYTIAVAGLPKQRLSSPRSVGTVGQPNTLIVPLDETVGLVVALLFDERTTDPHRTNMASLLIRLTKMKSRRIREAVAETFCFRAASFLSSHRPTLPSLLTKQRKRKRSRGRPTDSRCVCSLQHLQAIHSVLNSTSFVSINTSDGAVALKSILRDRLSRFDGVLSAIDLSLVIPLTLRLSVLPEDPSKYIQSVERKLIRRQFVSDVGFVHPGVFHTMDSALVHPGGNVDKKLRVVSVLLNLVVKSLDLQTQSIGRLPSTDRLTKVPPGMVGLFPLLQKIGMVLQSSCPKEIVTVSPHRMLFISHLSSYTASVEMPLRAEPYRVDFFSLKPAPA